MKQTTSLTDPLSLPVGARPRPVWSWRSVGLGALPFANAATAELPMSRLLRLSLFQVTVGMAVELLVGT